MDWNFLLLLAGGLVIACVAMGGGYWVGKHNAYVEMMNDEVKLRVDDYRRRLRELQEGNGNDGSNPDH